MDNNKTFKEILFEHGIDTMSLNDDFNTQLLHAGERYAEQQVAAALSTQSPKWVKASERLPENRGHFNRVVVKGYHKSHPFLAYGFRNYDPDTPTMYIEAGYKSFLTVKGDGNFNSTYPIDYIEWLDESPSSTHPLQEKIDGFSKLFGYLAEYGGKIVCSNQLSTEWIKQAVASGRMYVDDNSIGYIWEPEIKNFPETEEEVLFLEKWYPLKFELPESLKTLDWLHKPINKQP